MFERFSEEARRVVVFAQEEARLLHHNHIGTEHLLLGVLKTTEGLGASVLQAAGFTLEETRSAVLERVPPAASARPGQIPFTHHAKTALEATARETAMLRFNEIHTPHLLLGIMDVEDGTAVAVLAERAPVEAIRAAAIGAIDTTMPSAEAKGSMRTQTQERLRVVEALIAAIDRREHVAAVIAAASSGEEATRAIALLLGVDDVLAKEVLQIRLDGLVNEGDGFRQERQSLLGLLDQLGDA